MTEYVEYLRQLDIQKDYGLDPDEAFDELHARFVDIEDMEAWLAITEYFADALDTAGSVASEDEREIEEMINSMTLDVEIG